MSSRLVGDGCRHFSLPVVSAAAANVEVLAPWGDQQQWLGGLGKLCRGNMCFIWLSPLLWKLGIGPNLALAAPFLISSLFSSRIAFHFPALQLTRSG